MSFSLTRRRISAGSVAIPLFRRLSLARVVESGPAAFSNRKLGKPGAAAPKNLTNGGPADGERVRSQLVEHPDLDRDFIEPSRGRPYRKLPAARRMVRLSHRTLSAARRMVRLSHRTLCVEHPPPSDKIVQQNVKIASQTSTDEAHRLKDRSSSTSVAAKSNRGSGKTVSAFLANTATLIGAEAYACHTSAGTSATFLFE